MVKRVKNILKIISGLILFPLIINGQQPSIYEISKMPFNTDLFSEISPVLIKDGIIFCSDRRTSGIKDRTSYDGRRLYNFYQADKIVKKDTSVFSKIVEVISERSSKFNNGPLCISPDGQTVYFTSEVETGRNARKKDFLNHSGIFIADKAGTTLMSVRPFKYNSPDYNVAHPSVSTDGKYLFFASDMPGGKGGSDLYFCTLVNGEWGTPVNMGVNVNSSGTENYPYSHPSGRLYFSSNRQGTLGKLDVYYTTLTNGKWDEPIHLPEPINSKSDDFAFVAQNNMQEGYFASNRNNSDDIFKFTSLIIRKSSCDTIQENSYCFRFVEENAVKLDTLPFRYEWKFGDGEKGTGIVVEHCYNGPGTYVVQLDVVNLITKEVLRNQKSDTLVVTDIEQPYITLPDIIAGGQKIMLSGQKTNLPGWQISRYYWNFGDESIGIGRDIDHTFLKPGKYNIQLIVSEDAVEGGTAREACISKNIIVLPKP